MVNVIAGDGNAATPPPYIYATKDHFLEFWNRWIETQHRAYAAG
jgi:hypothetical protein